MKILALSTVFFIAIIPLVIKAEGLDPAYSCWGPSARQFVMNINIDHGNTPRAKNYLYKANSGYKICYATTNENNANPHGQISFHNKTATSSEVSIELPCGSGGIDPGLIAGAIAAYYCGSDCAEKAAAGAHFLAEKSGNSCGVGGETNWFEGNAVFVVFPETESCPSSACQPHPNPWEKF